MRKIVYNTPYYEKRFNCNAIFVEMPNINMKTLSDFIIDNSGNFINITAVNENNGYFKTCFFKIDLKYVHFNDYENSKKRKLKKHIKEITEFIMDDYEYFCERYKIIPYI